MEAVALKDLSPTVLNDVARYGEVRHILGTDCAVVPKKLVDAWEEVLDWEIEREAAERLKKPNLLAECITLEDLMVKYGITQADLDKIPEVEFE